MGEWALIVTMQMGFLTSNSTPTYFPSQAACEMQAAQINAPLVDQTINTAADIRNTYRVGVTSRAVTRDILRADAVIE